MNLTKEDLKKWGACSAGYEWYLRNGKDTVEATVEALMVEGNYSHANWLIAHAMPTDKAPWYGLYAAKQALPIFEKEHPKDNRPRVAIEALEKYLNDPTEENKKALRPAADAADAAYAAYAADAAYVAYAAYAALDSAAYAAAYAAYAADAAYVAYAAYAALDSADSAAYAADAAAYAAETKEKIINYGLKLIKEA